MSDVTSPKSVEATAEALEHLTVQLIQEKKWDALEKMLDPACQFVGAHGAYDRSSTMALIRQMNLGPVVFKDFKVTQSDENVVISFWMAAIEYQDGKALSPQFSPRLSVWRITTDSWLCIAYADLIATQK